VKKPRRKAQKPLFAAAYPSYSRSLTTQFQEDPQAAGVRRGLGTGALGAILGALAGKLIKPSDPWAAGAGALAGGVIGGVPGYYSGKQEALSDYSRLLFLRRLGITRPGELEALLQKEPEATKKVLEEGATY
jgi:hypothetical protein